MKNPPAVLRLLWAIGVLLFSLAAAPLARAQPQQDEFDPQADPTAIDPPARVARLSLINGEVSFAPAGTDEWAEAVLNRPITSEDRLWVGSDGRAELQIDTATVHLDRSTRFGFIQLDDGVMQMSLTEGATAVRVRRLAGREIVQVETPNATVRVKHPGEYSVEVDPRSDRTVVKVRSGEAEVTGGARTYTVRAGEQGEFSGLENLRAQTSPIPLRTAFESWANDRDRRAEESASASYVSPDVVGYEDLDEYGDWAYELDYGYVWRPWYVAAGWAPYRFGRWTWISPWGWTWIDAAPWGFAPFHFGRWAFIRHRWCWVPGPIRVRPVFAPALVGWVGGPFVSVSLSFGGVGWFPLGPHEIFVPGFRHTPRFLHQVNVSNTIIFNDFFITNEHFDRRRPEFRFRHDPQAVTAVRREDFVAGRPIDGRRVRLSDDELRQWRDDSRPPAIAPRRESVLAGQPRGPVDNRDWDRLSRRGGPARIDFDSERRAIQEHGGRPIPRSDLVQNPKRQGDFRVMRAGASEGVSEQRESQVAPGAPRAESRGRTGAPERLESQRLESQGLAAPTQSERAPRASRGEAPVVRMAPERNERRPDGRMNAGPPARSEATESMRSFGGSPPMNSFRVSPQARPGGPPVHQFSEPPRQREAAPPSSAPRQSSPSRQSGQRGPSAGHGHGAMGSRGR